MSHTNYTLFLYDPLPYAPSERFSHGAQLKSYMYFSFPTRNKTLHLILQILSYYVTAKYTNINNTGNMSIWYHYDSTH